MSERGALLHDPSAKPRDVRLPIAGSPDAITVMVVGGAGKHSCWQPTSGHGTRPTWRLIARRDGTPGRRAAELWR